jgi:hypothetical protein
MSFRSLTFFKGLWLLPMAALAAAPAAADPIGKNGASKEAAPPKPEARPEPRPALWLLADADTRIYMFGTIHVLPPGFRWRSAALDKSCCSLSASPVAAEEAVLSKMHHAGDEAAARRSAWASSRPSS